MNPSFVCQDIIIIVVVAAAVAVVDNDNEFFWGSINKQTDGFISYCYYYADEGRMIFDK